MYEVVCFRFEDFRVVEPVVEVIGHEVQVFWLIGRLPVAVRREVSGRQKFVRFQNLLHWVYIDASHL